MNGTTGNRARILASRCLLGEPVRFDGRAKPLSHPLLHRWREEGRLVPVCPELLGGLSVPRAPAEIIDGDGADVLAGRARVRTIDGADVTEAFIAGAEAARRLAAEHGCRLALLKENSPSCGLHRVHDGTFSGTLQAGMGITAAMLKAAGLAVFSENEIEALAAALQELEARNRGRQAGG